MDQGIAKHVVSIQNDTVEINRWNSYSLAYEVEAVIPVEISLCSTRISDFFLVINEESMVRKLDSVEEHLEVAMIHLADYQRKLAQWYNKDVKTREFGGGAFVLQRAVGSARDINAEKLALNWEGPYRVTDIVGIGAYYLEDIEERPLLRPWNVQNLKIFYH